jgi:hypothetical protein
MRTLRLTVDDITENAEGELLASLVTADGDGFIIPVSLLPEGTREGDMLNVTLERDPDETERVRRRIQELQRRLFGD